MEYRRRQFLTRQGESLLLPLQAMDIVERLTALTRSSGLDNGAIVSSTLVAIPLALRDPGSRWPANIEPQLLWNPLFWLPERLAYPADGVSNDTWAISVMVCCLPR